MSKNIFKKPSEENTNNNDPIKIDEKEFAVSEQQAAESGLTYTHKFREAFEFEGKKYDQMTFDWGKLTGADGLAIENEMQQQGKPVIAPTFSGEYLIRLAAKACTEKIGSDAFRFMPLSDYNRIRSAARSFLLKSEL